MKKNISAGKESLIGVFKESLSALAYKKYINCENLFNEFENNYLSAEKRFFFCLIGNIFATKRESFAYS